MIEQNHSSSLRRRCYERFNVDAQATLIINKNLEQSSILVDLSTKGAGLFSNYPLKVDEEIEIVIIAPFFFKEPIHRRAKVAWCKAVYTNSWQAGLDFGLDNLEMLLT